MEFTYCLQCYLLSPLTSDALSDAVNLAASSSGVSKAASTRESKKKPHKEEQPETQDQQTQNAKKRIRVKQWVIQQFSSMYAVLAGQQLLDDQRKGILLDLLRQFVHALRAACIRESYLVSLVGLYMCGLTAVNLLNAGYSMLQFINFFVNYTNSALQCYFLLRLSLVAHLRRNSGLSLSHTRIVY